MICPFALLHFVCDEWEDRVKDLLMSFQMNSNRLTWTIILEQYKLSVYTPLDGIKAKEYIATVNIYARDTF